MSGPNIGGMLVGTFLLLFGLCLLLVGGGCTITWLMSLVASPASALVGLPVLLISAATAWGGIVLLRSAGRMFREG